MRSAERRFQWEFGKRETLCSQNEASDPAGIEPQPRCYGRRCGTRNGMAPGSHPGLPKQSPGGSPFAQVACVQSPTSILTAPMVARSSMKSHSSPADIALRIAKGVGDAQRTNPEGAALACTHQLGLEGVGLPLGNSPAWLKPTSQGRAQWVGGLGWLVVRGVAASRLCFGCCCRMLDPLPHLTQSLNFLTAN